MGEDVFECRVEFAHLIAPLALSKKTLSQASMYAISHYSIHQDLTDVIISELKESILVSSVTNGWFGYRDVIESKISTLLGIIFHPKRHLDYHIEHITKLFKLLAKKPIFSPETAREITTVVDIYVFLDSASLSKDYDKIPSSSFSSEIADRFDEERDLQKRLRDDYFRENPTSPGWHPIDFFLKNTNTTTLSKDDVRIMQEDLATWKHCFAYKQ